ncbi:putative RNA-directed DNA polymerase [Helianthus annuus]|nr:putative RNA-directed DNA polymerase [Helianthus annuus]KAJ0849490.1 putative RNA-directed DNA polymerase [Helianthus annuus]
MPACMHGDLEEEVYMKIPEGFAKQGEARVCRLRKLIYGLKQASGNWYKKFTKSLVELGFRQSKADYSLFIYKSKRSYVAAFIYVDDVVIVGNDSVKIQHTKDQLDEMFSIKDMGPLKYFLGIEVSRIKECLVLSQRKYTLDILRDSGLEGCKPSSFPMEQNLKLGKGEGENKVDSSQYRRLVGRLLYLQATRPDITYAVNILSQFVTDPLQNHMDAATRVLRYLKSTPGQGILLPKEVGMNLLSYCDADWLGCPFVKKVSNWLLIVSQRSAHIMDVKEAISSFKIICRSRVQSHGYYCQRGDLGKVDVE